MMANRSLRCQRADGGISAKNMKTTSEILSVMERYELMDLLRAKRGGELSHVINNQSQLTRDNSETAFELDGIDEGKSPSLLSSIEDREDLDFHDESFVQHSEVSSTSSSSYKSLKIRLGSSSSTDGLGSPPDVLSSSSDNIFTPRKSSDSSMSIDEESGPPSSTPAQFSSFSTDKAKGSLASPKGVSVGGQSQISKYHERGGISSSSKAGKIQEGGAGGAGKGGVGSGGRNNATEAQSFFSRAITGIRSGSQSNVTSGSGGNVANISSSSSGSGSGSGGKQPESDEKQMDFFSRALTGIRSSPQKANDNDKVGKAKKLENKLQQMTHKSKKFDHRLMELEKKMTDVDTKPKENSKAKPKEASSNSKNKEVITPKKESGLGKVFQKEKEAESETQESDARKETEKTTSTRPHELVRRGSSQLLAGEVARRASMQSAAKREREKEVEAATETAKKPISVNDTAHTSHSASASESKISTTHNTPSSSSNSTSSVNNSSGDSNKGGEDDTTRAHTIDSNEMSPEDDVQDNSHHETDDNTDINISNFTDIQFNTSEDDTETDEFSHTQEAVIRTTSPSPRVPQQEVVSAAANRRLNKEYSYEDLRRKSIIPGKSPSAMSGPSPSGSRHMSVTKQFSEEVLSIFADREELLNDAEFEKVFSMTKEKFRKLPKWRRQELKKRHKLF